MNYNLQIQENYRIYSDIKVVNSKINLDQTNYSQKKIFFSITQKAKDLLYKLAVCYRFQVILKVFFSVQLVANVIIQYFLYLFIDIDLLFRFIMQIYFIVDTYIFDKFVVYLSCCWQQVEIFVWYESVNSFLVHYLSLFGMIRSLRLVDQQCMVINCYILKRSYRIRVQVFLNSTYIFLCKVSFKRYKVEKKTLVLFYLIIQLHLYIFINIIRV